MQGCCICCCLLLQRHPPLLQPLLLLELLCHVHTNRAKQHRQHHQPNSYSWGAVPLQLLPSQVQPWEAGTRLQTLHMVSWAYALHKVDCYQNCAAYCCGC
jgi:hypothetical protein